MASALFQRKIWILLLRTLLFGVFDIKVSVFFTDFFCYFCTEKTVLPLKRSNFSRKSNPDFLWSLFRRLKFSTTPKSHPTVHLDKTIDDVFPSDTFEFSCFAPKLRGYIDDYQKSACFWIGSWTTVMEYFVSELLQLFLWKKYIKYCTGIYHVRHFSYSGSHCRA